MILRQQTHRTKWVEIMLVIKHKCKINVSRVVEARTGSCDSTESILRQMELNMFQNMTLMTNCNIQMATQMQTLSNQVMMQSQNMILKQQFLNVNPMNTHSHGLVHPPVKCNMMQLTRKRINKIHASYTLEGTNLENVESIKYLGVTITSDLRWNTHVSNACTKANRTLGFLRRNLHSCPQEVKEAAYKGLVRPVLDYGSSVWDPPCVVLQEELESVQKRAARFVTGNYNYETGSMAGILGQLKWESLKKRRKDNRLILLYKGLKGKASVPTDDLIPKTRRVGISTLWHFRLPLPIQMFIKVASSPRLSGIGMPSPIH